MYKFFYFNYPDTKVASAFIWKRPGKKTGQVERAAREKVCVFVWRRRKDSVRDAKCLLFTRVKPGLRQFAQSVAKP
jgi:hypothetical protein